VTLALAAALISGCGGDDDETTGAAGTDQGTTGRQAGTERLPLWAPASGDLRFSTDVLVAPEGFVQITFDNFADIPHSFCLENPAGEEIIPCSRVNEGVPGPDVIASAQLKPGIYTYYCDVDGHRKAGMEGELGIHDPST
jgi:hypothetical protein